MDKSRKCFRLVGDVLVERTAGETLPAVRKNKENLVRCVYIRPIHPSKSRGCAGGADGRGDAAGGAEE